MAAQFLMKAFHVALAVFFASEYYSSRDLTLDKNNKARTNIPKTYIIDFDGTITQFDTSGLLFRSVLELQEKRGNDYSRQWQENMLFHNQDLENHIHDYRPTEFNRRTVKEEIEFQRSLQVVQEMAFNRLSVSRIFSDINERKWIELGKRTLDAETVLVREGFVELIKHLRNAKAQWAVLSEGFSSAFIKGWMGSWVGNYSIIANQPNYNGVLRGPRGPILASSDAKLTAAMGIMGPYDGRPLGKTVYIGDSGIDIECLLADNIIGIVIAIDGKSDLLRTLRRIGVKTDNIENYDEMTVGTIYWAHDFLDIVKSPLMS